MIKKNTKDPEFESQFTSTKTYQYTIHCDPNIKEFLRRPTRSAEAEEREFVPSKSL